MTAEKFTEPSALSPNPSPASGRGEQQEPPVASSENEAQGILGANSEADGDRSESNAEPEQHERATSPSPACGRGVGERARKVQLLKHARSLRSNQTDAEQRLWYHLRGKRFMDLKFKRQKPIGPFIADFVCMEYRLVIEADGGQHGGGGDRERDAWFADNGFKVLRFWNNDILGETEVVLEQIRETLSTLSPSPSPAVGRGEQ